MSSTRSLMASKKEDNFFSTARTLSELKSESSESMGWTHIELGAANYGMNLQADSCRVFKKLGKAQHKVLFDTVDALIQQKGLKGVFYLNDLEKKSVSFTMGKLREYLKDKHPNNEILLVPLVGDFFIIDLPNVDTIHLKNPEVMFFTRLYSNQTRFAYIADRAKEGLRFVTYFKTLFLMVLPELGVGYQIMNVDYQPYLHIDGTQITMHGNVVEFDIRSKRSLLNTAENKEYVTKTFFNKNLSAAYLLDMRNEPDRLVPPSQDEDFSYLLRPSTLKKRYR